MAATTTPSINWLIEKLIQKLPETKFVAADIFAWSPDENTILYDNNYGVSDAAWQLLHEAGHALLGHRGYRRDIELIGYEVSAWEMAKSLAIDLALVIPDDIIENHLDTYRDWLHARSQCVSCSQTGIQTSPNSYRCLHCPTTWRVNDGRHCGLRRYKSD